jgi:hypothetical protein
MYKIKLETLSFANLQRGVADRLGTLGTSPLLLLIRYQDSDGDEVSIANDMDLTEALREQPGGLKLLCSLKNHAEEAAGAMSGTPLGLRQEIECWLLGLQVNLLESLPATGECCSLTSGDPKGPLAVTVEEDRPPISGGKSVASCSASSRGAARVEASAAAAGGVVAEVASVEGSESLDLMMERLKDLHRKLKTGTAERTDAAELERLKRRYEAAACGALKSKAETRIATRERIVEMKGAIETATRRKVTNCRKLS